MALVQKYRPYAAWRRTVLWISAAAAFLLALIGYAPFVPGGMPMTALCFLAMAGCYLVLLFSRRPAARFAVAAAALIAVGTTLYVMFEPDFPRWEVAPHGLLVALTLFPQVFPISVFAILARAPRTDGRAARFSLGLCIPTALLLAVLLVPLPQRVSFDAAPVPHVVSDGRDTPQSVEVALSGWSLDWLVLPDRFVGTLTADGAAYQPVGELSADWESYRVQSFWRELPDGRTIYCDVLFPHGRTLTPAYISVRSGG